VCAYFLQTASHVHRFADWPHELYIDIHICIHIYVCIYLCIFWIRGNSIPAFSPPYPVQIASHAHRPSDWPHALYIDIHICTYICTHMYIYIYIYISVCVYETCVCVSWVGGNSIPVSLLPSPVQIASDAHRPSDWPHARARHLGRADGKRTLRFDSREADTKRESPATH